jgi:hypothetical protein
VGRIAQSTGYELDGTGIESRWGRDSSHLSRPALGATQRPVQWVPCLSRGVKSGQGVMLTHYPLLVPWSWKGTAIPLLPLRAVRPVQSLSACIRVHFTFVTFLRCDSRVYVQTQRIQSREPIEMIQVFTYCASDLLSIRSKLYTRWMCKLLMALMSQLIDFNWLHTSRRAISHLTSGGHGCPSVRRCPALIRAHVASYPTALQCMWN